MRWPRRVPSYRLSAALVAGAVVAFTSMPGARQASLEVRPGDRRRTRHRSAQRHRRHSGHRDCRRRRRRRRSPRRRRGRKDHRRLRLVRDAGPGGHPHPCLRGHWRTTVLRRRQQRLSRRVHLQGRRDHGCRCGRLGLAQFRGLPRSRHRPGKDARARLPQHRRPRDARRHVRAGPGRHGVAACRRHGPPASRRRSSASRPRTTRDRSGRRSSARSRRARWPTCR